MSAGSVQRRGERNVSPGDGTAKVRVRVPLRCRRELKLRDYRGQIRCLSVLWTTRKRWANRDESSDPAWRCIAIGDAFVIALRLD